MGTPEQPAPTPLEKFTQQVPTRSKPATGTRSGLPAPATTEVTSTDRPEPAPAAPASEVQVERLADGSDVIEGEATQRSSTPLDGGSERSDQSALRYMPSPVVQPNRQATRRLARHLELIVDQGGMPFGQLVGPDTQRSLDAGQGKGKKPEPVGQPEVDDTARWPSGPVVGKDRISPVEMERLVECILADPEVMDHPTQPGLSNVRLKDAARAAKLDIRVLGRLSGHVLLWFARAGITVSTDDRNEWGHPRPLATNEKEMIRRKLLRCNMPTSDEVKAARQVGLKDGFV